MPFSTFGGGGGGSMFWIQIYSVLRTTLLHSLHTALPTTQLSLRATDIRPNANGRPRTLPQLFTNSKRVQEVLRLLFFFNPVFMASIIRSPAPSPTADFATIWAFLEEGIDNIMSRSHVGIPLNEYSILHGVFHKCCTSSGTRSTSQYLV
jgi:hypothetical protein